MELYIVRHGEAQPETVDPQRPLTDQGIASTKRMAVFFKRADVRVDMILHSPKLRAKQTAQILKEGLNLSCPLRMSESLVPEGSSQKIYEEILRVHKNVMVVGHLPFLDKLVSQLVVGDETQRIIKFLESSAAILEQDVPPLWRITGYITPEMAGGL